MLSYEEFCTAISPTCAESNEADVIEASIKLHAPAEIWQLFLQLETARMAEVAHMTAKAYELLQQK